MNASAAPPSATANALIFKAMKPIAAPAVTSVERVKYARPEVAFSNATAAPPSVATSAST